MPDFESIAPSNLVIDEENPRLREPNTGQRETLRAIAAHQKRKLLSLARDILESGLNPADLPIVTPIKSDRGRFKVLEGNRRIAAIKALENPEFLDGAIDKSLLTQFRQLNKRYQSAPIDAIACLVVNSAEDAHHWIELRHTGENQGAGIVPWGSEEVSRFAARSGALPPEQQVLDFLEQGGYLTAAERAKVPSTSLRRLLSTPGFRQKVGIGIEKRQVKQLADKKKIGKALAWVSKNLANGETNTADIYTAEQRIGFANSLPKRIVVEPSRKSGPNLTSTEGYQQKPRQRVTKKVKKTKARDRLIPADCVMQVTNDRVEEIEGELRRLRIDDFPNAIAVLLRVFFELSIDSYIEKHSVTIANDKLIVKGLAVVEDLLKHKKLTAAQAKPVRKACTKNSYLAPSVPVMHDYVHCQYAFPLPSDLRAYWNNLQPFFVAIWSS